MDLGKESEGRKARYANRYKPHVLLHCYIHGNYQEHRNNEIMVCGMLTVLLWYIGIFIFACLPCFLRKAQVALFEVMLGKITKIDRYLAYSSLPQRSALFKPLTNF